MLLIFGPCPHCGAPIFMNTSVGDASIVDLAQGLWQAVPDITYTCKCHDLLADVPQRMAEVADTARRLVRPGSFGTGRRE
jgi:hypothetical protein